MAVNIYRNQSLIHVGTYETHSENVDSLVNELRKKWALLREKGLAADYPVEVLRSDGQTAKVIEVFRWKQADSRAQAVQDKDLTLLTAHIDALIGECSEERFTQVIRGFNSNFPKLGGVELLKGVCSCLVTIEGVVRDFPMSVKNGIVLMHRSPRIDFDNDGRHEMYLKILMHGGDGDMGGDGGDGAGHGLMSSAAWPIRVEQNFNRPNDGIVKSNGVGDTDFPGMAIWRVYWRIHTALGPVITDPDTPLIFGPSTVHHYPPVGTHFHSPTGPVALIHESTGQTVGTLKPGELTAFDIVVTKDDEVFADILNAPPSDLLEILGQYTSNLQEQVVA